MNETPTPPPETDNLDKMELKDFIQKVQDIVAKVPEEQKEARFAISLLLKLNNMYLEQINLMRNLNEALRAKLEGQQQKKKARENSRIIRIK